jgi:hypothetical protein
MKSPIHNWLEWSAERLPRHLHRFKRLCLVWSGGSWPGELGLSAASAV